VGRCVVSKFDPVAFSKHAAQEVTRAMRAAIDPLKQRIAKLEAELAEAKAQIAEARAVKYCGVWRQQTYSKGSFVSHAGSMWHANVDTDGRPNESHIDWTLCVKRGRDAR